MNKIYEQGKTKKVSSAPRKDSDQSVDLPSLIRILAVFMEVGKVHVPLRCLIGVLAVLLQYN